MEHRAGDGHHPRGDGRLGRPVDQRAIAAIDAGKFLDEIIPLKIEMPMVR